MNNELLSVNRRLEGIEAAVAALAQTMQQILDVLTDEQAPAEQRTLDGELFSTAERDPTTPL